MAYNPPPIYWNPDDGRPMGPRPVGSDNFPIPGPYQPRPPVGMTQPGTPPPNVGTGPWNPRPFQPPMYNPPQYPEPGPRQGPPPPPGVDPSVWGPNGFVDRLATRNIGTGNWREPQWGRQNNDWMPYWYRSEDDPAALAEAQRRFRTDLSTGDELAMQEWENYLANQTMGYLNAKDASAVGTAINVLGNDQGPSYDTANMQEMNLPGMRAGAEADLRFQQANKWDDFLTKYEAGKQNLFGSGAMLGEFRQDGTLDPFESMDRFVQSAADVGKRFALDPVRREKSGAFTDSTPGTQAKTRLNRWEEADLNEQWTNLANTSGINPNSPLFRAMQSMVMPTRYKPNASASAFRVGSSAPRSGGFARSQF